MATDRWTVGGADRLAAIKRWLEALRIDTGAQCVFLADPLGKVVVQAGISAGLELDALGALVCESFAGSFAVARHLNQGRTFNLHYQEGGSYNLYASNLGQKLVLITLFGKDAEAARVGAVWVYTRRAIRDLLTVLPDVDSELIEERVAAAPARPAPAPAARPSAPVAPPAQPAPDPNTPLSLEEAVRLGLIDASFLDADER